MTTWSQTAAQSDTWTEVTATSGYVKPGYVKPGYVTAGTPVTPWSATSAAAGSWASSAAASAAWSASSGATPPAWTET